MQNINNYVFLIWLLTAIIIFLIFFLSYLYIAMTRAQEKESLTLSYTSQMLDGIETERLRVSRELHDTILPEVKGLPVHDKIRMICTELMPPDFSRLPLTEAIADTGKKFSGKSGIECVFSIDEDVDFSIMSADKQLHLYRIIQEALANIEKHSNANRAVLAARNDSKGLVSNILVCISDDGKGLGIEHIAAEKEYPNERLGMRSMRQRAAIIGAKLDFISEAGNGLMVKIELPPPPHTIDIQDEL